MSIMLSTQQVQEMRNRKSNRKVGLLTMPMRKLMAVHQMVAREKEYVTVEMVAASMQMRSTGTGTLLELQKWANCASIESLADWVIAGLD